MNLHPRHVRRASACLLAAVALLSHAPLPAGNMQSGSNAEPAETAPKALDGKTFKGEIGQIGGDAFSDDTWVFDNGLFASMECQKCGFPKGTYTVTREGNAIHFRTETTCPVTDAALVYTGTVKDGRIEGTYTWTKERWYWTIEKDFWFEGELVDSADVTASTYP